MTWAATRQLQKKPRPITASASRRTVVPFLREPLSCLWCLYLLEMTTMKVRWRDSLYLGLLCGSLLAQSSSSPAGALEELATTQNPKGILRHFPQSLQYRLQALPAMNRGQDTH